MTSAIDLNADLGELTTAQGRDWEREILSYVSSANLACGGHAGDPKIMAEMCRLAKARGVAIGAHPAYPDRANFGRVSKQLGIDILARDLTESLMSQIVTLSEIACDADHPITYIKPHGALYNDTATQPALAHLICDIVKALDPDLAVMGFPGGNMQEAAAQTGLRFIGEAFIDRAYMPDGTLVPRGQDGAVLGDQHARLSQMKRLVFEQKVKPRHGEDIALRAQSLCLHGDSAGALETAKAARNFLDHHGVKVVPAR